MSAAFVITSLIIVLTPGTGVVYTVATGLARGQRAAIIAALGCTLGIVPHLLAAVFGLSVVLHASAVAFQTLKSGGVVYLLYLAWVTLRERGALNVAASSGPGSARYLIGRAVIINLLNPKLSIFFFAFLPQFISASELHPLSRTLALGGFFMLLTLVVFVCYGVLAASVRAHVLSRPQVMLWLRRVFAAAFVALGVRLAFEER